jgi:hypothetical protein
MWAASSNVRLQDAKRKTHVFLLSSSQFDAGFRRICLALRFYTAKTQLEH